MDDPAMVFRVAWVSGRIWSTATSIWAYGASAVIWVRLPRRRALAQSFQCWSKAAWTKVGSGVVGVLPRRWPGTSRKKEMGPRCADWT
ncbi:hypothetical protein [Streptomyces sp. NPDC091219]|uniref:hypothetical protein n=1 Tax=Streptomyces sp. NPDC091219 TaxID=3155193 RepID=UPI00344D2306